MSESANTPSRLSSIESAIEAYRRGDMVIIVDDEDRENEGDLAFAADFATSDAINFMATHGRGLICLSMRAAMLDRLKVPMMVPDGQNSSGFGTGFTISVEAAEGVSTGISTADRAHTILTMINPTSTTSDIAMPGHIFPLRARDGGVLERRGQTEASVDLAVLAGLTPAGVICEVMETDGTMMRLPGLLDFAKEHNMPVISVEALARYREASEDNSASAAAARSSQDVPGDANHDDSAEYGDLASLIGSSRLPTEFGEFRMHVFRDHQGHEHSALVMGEMSGEPPLLRLHSECLTGDAFGSTRCDCGAQLRTAMQRISEAGCGVLLYMRQEGRGIGLGNKIRAYALQDTGLDTVDANHQLGFPADARHYDVAAAILSALGIFNVRLLSNNPAKRDALVKLGIPVSELMPLIIPPHKENAAYLDTKAQRMGHVLPAEPAAHKAPNDRSA